ncbi:MAG TPA: hypothetical protein DCP32_12835 [Anaerolineaceae bacterium]|nr:MAG: hypothetical protein A2X24_03045 [Chloroflexi bacterium GWB2_54_36]HAL17587.1 hypothetical protein [Anaerolineaceae bacterium]
MIFINGHEIVLDHEERLEPWTDYGRVVWLAMNFIKNCPVEAHNGLPWYLQYSCFWTDPLRPVVWPDNPAGKFAWAVTTLLKYYPYSGDATFVDITRTMLERLWEQRTPEGYAWAGLPYASAHPGTGGYFGARADGEYVTEPDKAAQAGKAYLDFYKLTGEERYFDISIRIATELTQHLRMGDGERSPWPFRVDVRDGRVVEEYTSHLIPAVRLFEDLARLGEERFAAKRDQVWDWLAAYPLKTNLWKGHFEDIRLDPGNGNRDQVSPLETARYILERRIQIPDWQEMSRNLILWVKDTLGGRPFFTAVPIHEQKYCYFVMGSHTARYASLCAQYAEATGDASMWEEAKRSFNWATYMAGDDGLVTVGVDRPDYYNQCWFTDGYFDYVPHFIDGMAAMPETAPADSDHLLHSTSVVQQINYNPYRVSYRTFSPGTQILRLTFKPVSVQAGREPLSYQASPAGGPGWTFDEDQRVLRIISNDREVVISGCTERG